MTTYFLTANAKQQFFTTEGVPAAGYLLYTYAANSTDAATTYVSSSGGANDNPIELDSRGEADIWLDPSLRYKYVLKTAANATIWTVDDISSVGSGLGGGLITGQCILEFVSSSEIQLSAYDGNQLVINSIQQTVDVAGVTLTTSGLVGDTAYYIYAYMDADVMTLEASTTAYTQSGTTGIFIKQDDETRSLVGTAYTTSIEGVSWISCDSWFNNKVSKQQAQKQTYIAFTTGGTSTAYTLTPSPSVGTLTDNLQFDVKFHTASGATPTIAVSDLTAVNLYYYDSTGTAQQVTAALIPTNWRSRVTYVTSIGGFLVRDLPAGNSSIITPGEVGSMALLYNFSRTNLFYGDTASGANLGQQSTVTSGNLSEIWLGEAQRAGDVTVPGAGFDASYADTVAVSGTWQCLGTCAASAYDGGTVKTTAVASLFQRIA